MDAAVMDMRKNAQRSAADNQSAARTLLEEGEDGTDLDFREAPEFLQSLPGHIKTAAKINQSQTVTEAVAKLLAKAAKRPWEEIRCELHKCFEKTEQIKTAKVLKEKFTAFTDDLLELRYSDFVTAEMVCETLQNVLAKFQPLCHKVVAAESKANEEQEKISAMIAIVWDELPKLVSKQELMDMDSGGSQNGKGKGKGTGKGNGKGGKGKGKGGGRGMRVDDMLNKESGDPSGDWRDRKPLCWQFAAHGKCGYGANCRFKHEQVEAEGTAARRAEAAGDDGCNEELELLRRFYIKHSGGSTGGDTKEVAVARRLSRPDRLKQAMIERNAKHKLKLQAAWKATKKAPTYRMRRSRASASHVRVH